jgi:hypothetical protein
VEGSSNIARSHFSVGMLIWDMVSLVCSRLISPCIAAGSISKGSWKRSGVEDGNLVTGNFGRWLTVRSKSGDPTDWECGFISPWITLQYSCWWSDIAYNFSA